MLFDSLWAGPPSYFVLLPTSSDQCCHTEPQDGMTHRAVVDFASLGAGGEHPQNIERDLHAWSRALLGFQLDPYYLKLDLLKENDEITEEVDVPCLLPHEVLHALWLAGPQQFQISTMGPGGPKDLSNYWNWALEKTTWARRHPALAEQDPRTLDKMIPIMLFVDGAEVFRNSEFYVCAVARPETREERGWGADRSRSRGKEQARRRDMGRGVGEG